jgi:glycosyltransferase involved in cell wall biosynthesis
MKVSVVLPSRNEEESIARCIEKSQRALSSMDHEIIVSDSSSDRTPVIARAMGAKVVKHERGYGNAYMEGFRYVTGDVIVMADSDSTYDLSEIPRFLQEIECGADLVIGSRFRGDIEDGAMPWLHRHVGSPLFNSMLRRMFGIETTDSHSGFRAIRRDKLLLLNLSAPGMEFASEMIINSKKAGLNITEIPIRYSKREGASKLRSLRDGWRHMRFIMGCSLGHGKRRS